MTAPVLPIASRSAEHALQTEDVSALLLHSLANLDSSMLTKPASTAVEGVFFRLIEPSGLWNCG